MSGCVAAVRQELSVADTGDDDQVPQNEEGVRKILFKPFTVCTLAEFPKNFV